MHDIDSALEVIRARDATAARLANGLWGAMRTGAAHSRVTRYDVQGVCWGALPLLARNPDSAVVMGDRHAAAAVLAELLELLGYPHYADICRGETTRRILDAAEDTEACTALAAAAWQESGVQPPNTPALRWGEVRGPVEQAVHAATGRIMEEAIASGGVDLDSPDAEVIRTALTMKLLGSPAEDLSGTWYSEIFDERLTTWLTYGGSQTRRELLVRVQPEVTQPPEPSPCDEFPALQTLLDACRGDGVRLTRNGYLPTALVRELVGLMPACADYPASGRGESRWPPLLHLRQLAVELELLTRTGDRLLLAEPGREYVDDASLLAMGVGERLVAKDTSARGVIQEVIFAALLLEDVIELDRLLDKVAVVIDEEGWGPNPRGLSTQELARDFGLLFLRWLHIVDALDADDEGLRVGLTTAGRAAARWGLRARVMLREVPT
ncbi:MAG TPA: hypothetical protein VGX25_29570 [Actinophytocola sp.]|uniref:hypothetical protein n=1 Tax=Actinophytocola sp. TaxID=1872138 RepID=UPI002DDD7FFF|nr:hypothetical protein [Actinophytocola sp.]HEV2783555.1 hypothetical protein [Actinophytocola sp.]